MTPRRKRLLVVLAILGGVAASVSLAVMASRENIMFYYDPSQIAAGQAPMLKRFRVGGMVVKGSVSRKPGDLQVRFVLTDFAHEVPVEYTGVLPDLFREGQGIIAHGTMGANGAFVADEVLAKHDEKYMPPEVAALAEAEGGRQGGRTRAECAGTDRPRTDGGEDPMAPELGIFALILAFVLSLSQAFFGLGGAWRGKPVVDERGAARRDGTIRVRRDGICVPRVFVREQRFLRAVRGAQFQFAAAAFLSRRRRLGRARRLAAAVDFDSCRSGAWRSPPSAASCRRRFSSRVLGVMGLISSGFMLFTLWTSNPFQRLIPAAQDGADLNPVLQDFALAIHPPMLYTGYVGFSVAFAFACAAMLEGRLDQAWAKWTRPWTIFRVDIPNHRHCARQLVGLLRTRLGRLVVLGSGGERLVHAMAGRHRA